MKTVRLIIGLTLAGLGAGCLEKPNTSPGTAATVLYRHHFLGTAELAHNTNAARIPAILALPATRAFSAEALQKLAKSPEQLWRNFLPAGASTQAALAAPLLEDLVSAESYAEVHGPLHQSESVFAIALNEQRAGLWRTNLGNILAGWKLGKPTPISLGEAKGWEVKTGAKPALVQFVRAGQWVLIGAGEQRLPLLQKLLEAISKTGHPVTSPPNVVLDLEADFPRLGEWLPALTGYGLPPIHLTVTGRGDHLRTELRLLYSEPIPWTSEPWKIPTNCVCDPIISFTVARGIGPLLSQVRNLPTLGLKPFPNQFCAWGPVTLPPQTLLSVPITNRSDVLRQIGPRLPDFTSNLLSQSIGGFALDTNRNALVWQGWPFILPRLWTVRDGGTDYLLGSMLPVRSPTNPPPPELFDQLKGRPNLVYYDWELTQERLAHAKLLQQVWDMAHGRMLLPTNAPTQAWLLAIAPHLGNTITEATLTSSKELTVVRRSTFGLTGIELATLARWVASPAFPWKFEPPSAPPRTSEPGGKKAVPPSRPAGPGSKK